MRRFNLNTSVDEVVSDTGEGLLELSVPVSPRLVAIHYKDINSNFSHGSRDLVLYDENAVNNQIGNILATLIGSEQFEPTYGSWLEHRLFENITPMNAHLIRGDSIDAVQKWMGDRVEIIVPQADVRMLENSPDGEGYIIEMPYIIRLNRVVGHYSAFMLR